MSSTRVRLARAHAISLALIVSAAVLPDSISPLAGILLPGLVVSSAFWSEGFHSGMRDAGVWMMFGVMYAASVIFWAIVVYSVETIARKLFWSRGTDK